MTRMTISHTSDHSWLAEVRSLLSKPTTTASRVAQHFKARRELHRLLTFPDYLLKDMGLQRLDIEREALKPLWRE